MYVSVDGRNLSLIYPDNGHAEGFSYQPDSLPVPFAGGESASVAGTALHQTVFVQRATMDGWKSTHQSWFRK